ncbi:uncharacterized protein LOC117952900 isoform X3 [Etheostoma cragini]|uniref:uncharacterized protein LOC117952900 isoform X3 n=1 Tax=Etheostoma cragini TaxID=417921 RepID=UPI00155ED557|nr:uncharacterized protein LOC117952900 isoform X3 [Etheostoma cragini]
MVIMFNRDHAALLSIQLYVMCQVYAEILSDTAEYRNMLVSRGDFVILTCNISTSNATQIHWTKGSSVFSYLVLTNKTVSNFTSHKIDVNLPTKLNISNVQHDDTGLYKCVITGKRGSWTVKWNLTVSRESEENSQLWSFLHILTAVTGLICVFTSAAVCLYRKLRARTPNQNPVQEQLDLQSEREVGLPQPQGVTEGRFYKDRSQYTERLNSIYGL